MDLTSAECKLLMGGSYDCVEDFVNDLALVFSNAIEFNRAGRDEGVSTSIAYFEASMHLLKYTRWLSLEYLAAFLTNDSDARVSKREEGPIPRWKLSTSYRQDSKAEMEGIVLKRKMELSHIGDHRYTWMESECEKLLKSLRHQSDWKYMSIFVKTIYPADYTAFIAKPRDWDYCDQHLKDRKYTLVGEMVEDVRLIFSNALKYNAAAKGTNTVSGVAYNAAVYMSKKLETAIDKMLLTISERIGREEVDDKIKQQELDVERHEAERLQEEEHRLASMAPSVSPEKEIDDSRKIEEFDTVVRLEQHQQPQDESADIDFEFSEDDDDGGHELAHLEAIRQQKNIFHRQLKARDELQKLTRTIGARVMQLAICKQDPQFLYDSRGLPILSPDSFHENSVIPTKSNSLPFEFNDGLDNDPRVKIPTATKKKGNGGPVRISIKKRNQRKRKQNQLQSFF
mmetsp:Transcript_14822/g.32855  ORF Transcript_14822/g.32855 Transcript_14822/m.32855 type:complete len:455 (+) Transcript_14822:2425-3789(+)